MKAIKTVLIWMIVSGLSSCANFPRIYSGDAIHGWVIDSKTKQPIEDVVVLEIWELYGHDSLLQMEGDHNGNAHIAETLTDENGYYSFPEWGPKFTMDGRLNESSPHLVFYKFGYDDVHLRNMVSGNLNLDNRISEHSGKKIEMVKFEGSPKEYYEAVDSIEDILNIGHYRSAFKCMWVKIPRFTSEVVYLREYISNQRPEHVRKKYPSTYLDNLSAYGCDNAREILKDYLK